VYSRGKKGWPGTLEGLAMLKEIRGKLDRNTKGAEGLAR